ncbi:phosphoenolpyruvate--protein phosphotransferase [Candidatus Desantisbacteria bacterium CG_4_10_14_0_8_um_filter_48_22]|uniref:Phosphoenolpyruvate-protein phosphotransferase n=1 Tax=Candidatus Desantisbacteria bacterium CG_4_10_14_0_8_um_filter_48_22 TaxID=1974543 RepID=A0A2M7S4N3_9BACT|nr:MAG: phosphoenolpyruvate--protein phosphotransferase [Candidatus Desantisbacteria bacterium CG_4_10_14_0_8_um_filter_48_22]
MLELKGIAASPGIAIGKAFFLDKEDFAIKRYTVPKAGIKQEFSRLDAALRDSRKELNELREKMVRSIGLKNARIFEAHLLLLGDPIFIDKIRRTIKASRCNVEAAVWEATEEITDSFLRSKDQFLQERAADIHDVGRRILHKLLGREREILADLKEETIVVAADLAPSDTAQMRREKVIAFVTDMGGRTSHTAIMARSLEIPAVVGLKDITQKADPGDIIVVDGNTGTVLVNPGEDVLLRYKQDREKFIEISTGLSQLREQPAITVDGHRVSLMANIEVPEEVGSALQYGAEGIGLYRTEFLFLNRNDLPDEEEQFEAYRNVARLMDPRPVTIRTLDLGGDKFLSQLNLSQEINPSLGFRGIRLCLELADIFRVQLRAILRASAFGNLKIMYPLISGMDELRRANRILDSVREELSSQGVEFNRGLEVGVMIEVPSAVMIADLLAKEAKFFSIGTNDLIQYALGIDRVNEKIAYLYEPLHPAVLRLVQRVIAGGHNAGIKVSMCGEMAGDPFFVPLLVGMGLDEFSMGPFSIPAVKQVINNTKLSEAKIIAEKAMNFSTAGEVESFLKAAVLGVGASAP